MLQVCTLVTNRKATKKVIKKDPPLKVNTSFENLLKMVINTPPKKMKNKCFILKKLYQKNCTFYLLTS
jgi:hypothetical protein